MAYWKRAASLCAILLIVLAGHLPFEEGGIVGTAAGFNEIDNQTFPTPAFLVLNLYWDDGADHQEALPLSAFYVYVDSGGIMQFPSSNPIATANAATVHVVIYPHSALTGNPIYDGSYTSGAAGSYRALTLFFNTSEIGHGYFEPVRVIFRPYDAATGAGLPFEQFNLTLQVPEGDLYATTYLGTAEIPIGLGYVDSYFGINLTLRVRDYFGNLLYNTTRQFFRNDSQTCMAVQGGTSGECSPFTSSFVTWDVPLSVHSFKVYNQNPDQFVLIDLYWNGSGTPFSWFQSPQETVERFLDPGFYSMNITTTLDSSTGHYEFNISAADYWMIYGLNITRFVGNFRTVENYQLSLLNQFTPDVIKIGTLLPSSPSQLNSPGILADYVLIHPFSILTGSSSYTGGTGTNSTLYEPSMNSSSGDGALLTTLTVLRDTYIFAGNSTAHVWINTTDGTNLWENSSLPPAVTLSGYSGDVIVETNDTVTAQRVSDFRAVWEFNVRYFPTTRRYEQTLTLNNTMNRTVLNPQWFVGFPDNTSVDLTSAAVKDLDNDVWLTQGQHFTTTQSGYFMDFAVLNASQTRTFDFVYYDSNASSGQTTQVMLVTSISRTTYQGRNNYWVGNATWSNTFTSAYTGELVIKLVCDGCDQIRMSSIVVQDASTGRYLDTVEWYGDQSSIKITAAAVGSVGVGGSRNYKVLFQMDLSPSSGGFHWFQTWDLWGIAFAPAYLFPLGFVGALILRVGIVGKKHETAERRRAYLYLAVVFLGATLFFFLGNNLSFVS